MNRSADEAFPHLTAWVKMYGWIEIGYDDYQRSFIRALDSGGMVWEGSMEYATLESALQALDEGLAAWMKENGITEKLTTPSCSLKMLVESIPL